MIGGMRHRVEIQSSAGSTDSMGGRANSFTTTDTVWANISEKSGRESLSRGKITDTATHTMTCRYISTLNTNSRVKYGDRLFNVISVHNPDGRSKYMEAELLEGAAT